MTTKKSFLYIFQLLLIFSSVLLGLSSCDDETIKVKDPNEKDPENETRFPLEKPAESTLLIYSVATNSLSGNLVRDKNEMLEASSAIDLSKNIVLLCETRYKLADDGVTRIGDVNLLRLLKNEEGGYWDTIMKYGTEVISLAPERISDVVDWVSINYPSDYFSMVFWSHSTASQPYAYTKSGVAMPEEYSFGQDLTTPDKTYQELNIDDLAAALPDNLLDFIWFDSCYMSNIESLYQLRNKSKKFGGYPTEVLDEGLPYQYVLPLMAQKNADLNLIADTFFEYYSNSIATVATLDMAEIEPLAEFCRQHFDITKNISTSFLMKYSRYTVGPFYDFGDYMRAMLMDENGNIPSELKEEMDTLLDNFVKFKAATNYDFSYKRIDQERYSGISTHFYQKNLNSSSEDYYRSLDWYKKVFGEKD